MNVEARIQEDPVTGAADLLDSRPRSPSREVPGREVAFGAVGKFWQADIEWRDTPLSEFVAYILRAVLRTIRSDAEMTTAGPVGP